MHLVFYYHLDFHIESVVAYPTRILKFIEPVKNSIDNTTRTIFKLNNNNYGFILILTALTYVCENQLH